MPRRKSKNRAAARSKQKDIILPLKKTKNEKAPIFVVDKIGDANIKMKYRNKVLTSHKILGIKPTSSNSKLSRFSDEQIKKEIKKIKTNEPQSKKKKQEGEAKYDLWGEEKPKQGKNCSKKEK